MIKWMNKARAHILAHAQKKTDETNGKYKKNRMKRSNWQQIKMKLG